MASVLDACSTPFGITAVFTPPATTRWRRPRRVLNAFRHHCCFHSRPRSPSSWARGAQRLSASLLFSRYVIDKTNSRNNVLNAFRHHCCFHFPSFRIVSRTGRAQRLSASLLFSRGFIRVPIATVSSCSTPFGITAVFTWHVIKTCRIWRTCSTPFGITAVFTRATSVGWVQPIVCSTPFGITAVFTPSFQRGTWSERDVFNAFRHHCCFHIPGGHEVGPGTVQCSTPFGITAVFTRTGRADEGDLHGCSTPFGITAVFTPNDGTSPWWEIECSTPFGITAVFTRSITRVLAGAVSAQRLSASLLFSPFASAGLAGHTFVLNAFRHHCCFHAILGDIERRGPEVLNAFRHHCCFHGDHCRADRDRAGCSTPFGITAVFTRGSVRRLEASGCAQRLSASLLFSRCGQRHLRRHGVVLNAFRHHCCFHTPATVA